MMICCKQFHSLQYYHSKLKQKNEIDFDENCYFINFTIVSLFSNIKLRAENFEKYPECTITFNINSETIHDRLFNRLQNVYISLLLNSNILCFAQDLKTNKNV